MFEQVISLENLCKAWEEFARGKKSKPDVQAFERRLMDNLLDLQRDLASGSYRHGQYHSFFINDPKRRHIHKASVRDRVVHHAIHRILYPFFDRTFIADSFSCRKGKGMHAALNRFHRLAGQASHNHTRTVWALKCDIRKFFAQIDHEILLEILQSRICDQQTIRLLAEVIHSFSSDQIGRGLPLGNLTSQLFANVYLNQFDQFVKHELKARFYVRYADDFVFLSPDRRESVRNLPIVIQFLFDRLHLQLHPDKIVLKTVASGVDFLGWVHFTDHRVLRRATARRMLRRLEEHSTEGTLQSYLGMLGHGNTRRLRSYALLTYLGNPFIIRQS